MIDMNNPMIYNPLEPVGIFCKQTRDTLTDPQIYLSLVHSAENQFRRSRFYTDYKSRIMFLGLNRDMRRPAITSEMANLEMHHNFIELRHMAIMIAEHYLNKYGCVDSFDIAMELENQHRKDRVAVIMLSATEHQKHHNNPTDFISINQCFAPNVFEFLDEFMDGMTLDIAFKLLLQLKLEDQHGGMSNNTNMIKARDKILNWQHLNNQ